MNLKQRNFANELSANCQDNKLKWGILLINKFLLFNIQRGFSRPKEKVWLGICIKHTANDHLSNKLVILKQILFIAKIYTHEYWNKTILSMNFR